LNVKTFHIDLENPSYKLLREAADLTLAGAVMVYPTDTIYGLGCDIYSRDAIHRIYTIKKRDPNKPFSFICENVSQISEFAFVSNWAYKLIRRCLPGPYTFILDARKTSIPKKMLGKRNTVGVRIPGNRVCNRLIQMIGHPIISTSVNLAGGAPLTDPAALSNDFSGKIDIIISIGPMVSDPSTVIDATGSEPVVIRLGAGPVPW